MLPNRGIVFCEGLKTGSTWLEYVSNLEWTTEELLEDGRLQATPKALVDYLKSEFYGFLEEEKAEVMVVSYGDECHIIRWEEVDKFVLLVLKTFRDFYEDMERDEPGRCAKEMLCSLVMKNYGELRRLARKLSVKFK